MIIAMIVFLLDYYTDDLTDPSPLKSRVDLILSQISMIGVDDNDDNDDTCLK